MNFPSALLSLLLFLQIVFVVGVMFGGIYLLSCLRRVADALETIAEAQSTSPLQGANSSVIHSVPTSPLSSPVNAAVSPPDVAASSSNETNSQ